MIVETYRECPCQVYDDPRHPHVATIVPRWLVSCYRSIYVPWLSLEHSGS